MTTRSASPMQRDAVEDGRATVRSGLSKAGVAGTIVSAYRDRSSSYGPHGFYNHLPMTVTALLEMGADAERAATWARRYAERHGLHEAGDNEVARRRLWHERLAAHENIRALDGVFPGYARRIGAAAFHCAIHAAYAIERDDAWDLSCALASWSLDSATSEATANVERSSVGDAIERLSRTTIRVGTGGTISTRMREVAAHPAYASIARAVPPFAGIDDLGRAAAVAFASSGDFIALHVMTGTQASHVLAGAVADRDALTAGLWQAYAAAAIASGSLPTLDARTLAAIRAAAPPDWEPLLTAAIAHDDEHVIKATYAAWRLDREIDDPIFRAAARRAFA